MKRKITENNLVIPNESIEVEGLTNLMIKLDKSEDQLNCIIDNTMTYELGDDYSWNERENNNGNIFAICDSANAIYCNYVLPTHIKSMIDSDNKNNQENIKLFNQYLTNYSNNASAQVHNELIYYFSQALHNAIYNISEVIDINHPELSVKEVIGIAMNTFTVKTPSIIGRICPDICGYTNVRCYISDIPDRSNFILHLNDKLLFASTATTDLHNFIYNILMSHYSCVLSNNELTQIMREEVSPILKGFHDSLIDLYEVMELHLRPIYESLNYISSYLSVRSNRHNSDQDRF